MAAVMPSSDVTLSARPSLRRLLIFAAVVRSGSLSAAASEMGLTQPAATSALAKLEGEVSTRLAQRGTGGVTLTPAGDILDRRVTRMLARMEAAVARASGTSAERAAWITRSVTDAQVRDHLAVAAAGSFRAAAADLGIAEPTLHRSVRGLEALVGRPLYRRQAHVISTTEAGTRFATEFGLALKEIDQALDELAIARGAAHGRLAIGCLPLMPKPFLAKALGELIRLRQEVEVSVEENSFSHLKRQLAEGSIDFILGALRRPPLLGFAEQKLFADPYVVVARAGHPLAQAAAVSAAQLSSASWVLPWRKTPRRVALEQLFERFPQRPKMVMETSSLVTLIAVLQESECLSLLCRSQIRSSGLQGSLAEVFASPIGNDRIVGVTRRLDWVPTVTQDMFLQIISRTKISV